MTNIVDLVWKAIDSEPCIRRDLNRQIINTRALAKYLIKREKLSASLDAVISAIRRYHLEQQAEIFSTAYSKIALTTSLSTKSSLANIGLIKDTEVQNIIPKLFQIIQYTRGEVLRIIQADERIKVLIDEKNLEKVVEIFPKEKIVIVDKNLAEINLHVIPEAKMTPGIVAAITNELAINGVNLVEVMTCFPEILWFVEEKDLLKAYHVCYQLCRPKGKNEK